MRCTRCPPFSFLATARGLASIRELGHRETCQLKLRAFKNFYHWLALRVDVTELVAAFELVPLHRRHIVAAVPAGAVLLHPSLSRGGVFVCLSRGGVKPNGQKED